MLYQNKIIYVQLVSLIIHPMPKRKKILNIFVKIVDFFFIKISIIIINRINLNSFQKIRDKWLKYKFLK